jgi:hypothetical protein
MRCVHAGKAAGPSGATASEQPDTISGRAHQVLAQTHRTWHVHFCCLPLNRSCLRKHMNAPLCAMGSGLKLLIGHSGFGPHRCAANQEFIKQSAWQAV